MIALILASHLLASGQEESPTEPPELPRLFHLALDPAWPGGAGSATPTWTRDGAEILFQSVREEGFAQIYAIRPDGTGLRRITDGRSRAGHPHCCPVDDRIALVSDVGGSREIYTQRLDGSDLLPVTRDGTPKLWPVFAPDGTKLAYVEEAEGGHRLCVLELSSSAIRVLHSSTIGLGWPTWSADGAALYFHDLVGNNHLFRIAADGTGLTRLTGGDSADFWAPQASPDGTRLAFVHGPEIDGSWGDNGDIVIARIDGSERVRLTTGPRHESAPRFSPDGARLAFLGVETGYWELEVMGTDGRDRLRLTSQPGTELTGVARRHGPAAALEHYDRLRGQGVLFSDLAMKYLLEDLGAGDEEAVLALAELYLETYPDSPDARQALGRLSKRPDGGSSD